MIATAGRADQFKAEAGIAATGRKAQKPVLAYSLAWHPNEAGKKDQAEMSRAANDNLRALGLEKYQAVIVAHRDTAHPHARLQGGTWREMLNVNKLTSLPYFFWLKFVSG